MTRVAAIDCGTNSLRLLVADLADGRLTDVRRRMEIVRLGQGVDRTGRLASEAIERTRVVLAEYAAEIVELGAVRTRMVATSATRDAGNAADFRAMVRETLGAEAEVASGDEEARLSFTGAVRGLPQQRSRKRSREQQRSRKRSREQQGSRERSREQSAYLVVDIGGGSTELVTGTSTVDSAVSVDVGCVRITERHLHGDPPSRTEVTAAEADIGAAIDRALSTVAGRSAGTLIGLAGSVTTVTAIALGLPHYDADRIHHARISHDEVAKVTTDLLAMSRAERLALPVMHPGRADVIGAGALILRVIMDRAGFDSVVASEHDILDGIAWSLA